MYGESPRDGIIHRGRGAEGKRYRKKMSMVQDPKKKRVKVINDIDVNMNKAGLKVRHSDDAHRAKKYLIRDMLGADNIRI